jgi:hypothetical protein
MPSLIEARMAEHTENMKVLKRIDAGLDRLARSAAKSVGLKAMRSRWRRNSIDNLGEFRVVDPNTNIVVAGERFDMSAKSVVDYCADLTA